MSTHISMRLSRIETSGKRESGEIPRAQGRAKDRMTGEGNNSHHGHWSDPDTGCNRYLEKTTEIQKSAFPGTAKIQARTQTRDEQLPTLLVGTGSG